MTNAPENPYRLDGQSIVVTGGSSGIGQATCIALAKLGASVVVHYHSNQGGAESTAAQIQAAGGQAAIVQADLRKPDDRLRLVDQSWQQWGDVTSWIHNAGADVLTGGAAKLSFEQKLDLLWSVDVQGTALLARAVAKKMLHGATTEAANPQDSDRVSRSMVFIGWDQAPHGMEDDAGQMFGPVKAAVMALSASMAQSCSPHVRVNCVAPGWIRTAWGDQTDEKWNRRATESSLLHRWGSAKDVAGAIAFLCSPAASFINAQVLEVNGGWNRTPRS